MSPFIKHRITLGLQLYGPSHGAIWPGVACGQHKAESCLEGNIEQLPSGPISALEN